jgi:hypothetical protein
MPRLRGAAHPSWKGNTKRMTLGYMHTRTRGHPRADKNGYVREHILIVELARQQELRSTAPVHHVNEDKTDNRNENLVACDSTGYHQLLHKRQRALDACGNANWRKCRHCKRYDAPENLVISRNQLSSAARHRACGTLYCAKFRARRRA